MLTTPFHSLLPIQFPLPARMLSTAPVPYRSKSAPELPLLSRAAQSWGSPALSGLRKLSTECQQNLTVRLMSLMTDAAFSLIQ